MLQLDRDFQSQNGSAWIKPAAGAAAGGTVILLAARRRRKKAARKQAEEAARSVRVRAVKAAGKVAKEAGPTAAKTATVVAAKAGPVARGAQERVTDGLDRVAKDRRVQTYAFAGLAFVWFLFRVSELRQLRKLNRRIA
jgi:methionine synthase I (cobalamin-dependent)